MGGIRFIVHARVKGFQRLRIGLGIDKDILTFLALDEVELTRDPKDPVPPFKKESMLIRSTDLARNRLHSLSHLFSNNDQRIPTHEDFIAQRFVQPVGFPSLLGGHSPVETDDPCKRPKQYHFRF